MAKNLVTYFIDSTARAARAAEVTGANWNGGLNLGGSNANGIGVDTGDYNNKVSDWDLLQDSTGTDEVQNSQLIGGAASGLFAINGADIDAVLAFGVTTGEVAPDGEMFTAAGFGMSNKTGKTVPSGARVWGVGTQT